jgi:hypothetical protein
VTVVLPDSLASSAKSLAERDNIPLDQFVTLAVAEKVSALMAEDYLRTRAAHGDRDQFLKVLDRAADAEPAPEDRLPVPPQ